MGLRAAPSPPDEQAFIARHGLAAYTAYAAGYNEGLAARNTAQIDEWNDRVAST